MPPKHVVVLGGGPGGLAAGATLAKHGIHTTVLERQPYVGGLCRTIEKNGFRFDLGGHRWFTKNEEVDRFVVELMGDEFIGVDRVSRIYFDNKFFDYPLKISNVIRNAGVLFSLRALLSYAQAHLGEAEIPPDAEVSMESAYTRQFGKVLYETFFKRYSEKVWGHDCRELSPDWVAQRTKGLSIRTAVRNAIYKPKEKIESLVEHFKYPKLGYVRISERMAAVTVANGGAVRLGTAVTALVHKDKTIQHILVKNKDGGEQIIEADQFISTIPVNALVRMMQPAVPEEILDAAGQLHFRALITVNLMLNREQVTWDHWLYIHDPKIRFARVHEPKNWSRAMAPPGQTSLVAEYFCTFGDEIWNSSDEALRQMTVRDLAETLRFIKEEEVIDAVIIRERTAYPIYTLGYEKPLRRLKSYIKEFSNLQIIGRGGTFRYNNSDHSIEAGIIAVKNLLGASYDLEKVNSASEYLEEKKVPVKVESVVDIAD